MKFAALVSLILLFSSMNFIAQTPVEIADIWDKIHISNIFPSNVRHKDLQAYLAYLKKLGLRVDEVGRSAANREIYQAEFGTGPTKVFLWSQMHGDEPTATSALIDMLAFFQTHRDEPWVKRISEMLTIRAVPMLNPDGAEAYQRRNLQGLDINRDALTLKTPEANLLKRLRDEWQPAIGFNLHNQQALTTVGYSGKQAAISLLVVFGDAAKTLNEGHARNQRVASVIVEALQSFIPGHIARYDDEFTSTAFGDNFSAWGTPVILIETGGLHGKDEMFLVKMNFVAFVTALNAVATGTERAQSPQPYLSLVENGSGGLYYYIFRRANIVGSPGGGNIYTADVAVNTMRRRAGFMVTNLIREIGNLNGSIGLEEYDAADFTVVQRLGTFKVGELAEFFFYRKDRIIDWRSPDLEKLFPPDAIFSGGKWFKGPGVVPLIKKQ